MENNLITEKKYGVTIIRLGKYIGAVEARKLVEVSNDLIEDGEKTIGIDLANVSFLTNEVIGAFHVILYELVQKGGDFRLFSASQPIVNTLRIAKMDDFFEIYRDEKEFEEKIAMK